MQGVGRSEGVLGANQGGTIVHRSAQGHKVDVRQAKEPVEDGQALLVRLLKRLDATLQAR